MDQTPCNNNNINISNYLCMHDNHIKIIYLIINNGWDNCYLTWPTQCVLCTNYNLIPTYDSYL